MRYYCIQLVDVEYKLYSILNYFFFVKQILQAVAISFFGTTDGRRVI